MADIKSWIIQHNRLTAPLLAILFSFIVVLAGVYLYGELLFLVPVVTFFTFHYTKLYKFRLRLLAGVIVFLVIAFMATGLLTNAVYQAQPTYHTQFYTTTGNSTGTNVSASVTPYSGSSSYYDFTLYITPNGTFDFNNLTLNLHHTGSTAYTIHYNQMQVTNFSGNSTEMLTYRLSSLPAGIYSYNLTTSMNGTIYTPEISGPINASVFTVYEYLLPTYAIYYVLIFFIIFVVGIFIGRSFSHSRSYKPPPPPTPPTPPPPPEK